MLMKYLLRCKDHSSHKILWPWKGPFDDGYRIMIMLSFRFSWAAAQPGCSAKHHLGRWLHQTTVCSTPRHYGWQVANDEGWFSSSCCREPRCQPTPILQRQDIPLPRPGKPEHRHQRARRNFLSSANDEYDPRETAIPLCWSATLPFPWLCRPFHDQTYLINQRIQRSRLHEKQENCDERSIRAVLLYSIERAHRHLSERAVAIRHSDWCVVALSRTYIYNSSR